METYIYIYLAKFWKAILIYFWQMFLLIMSFIHTGIMRNGYCLKWKLSILFLGNGGYKEAG